MIGLAAVGGWAVIFIPSATAYTDLGSPVRKSQRSGSALNRLAYSRRIAGVSCSGSTVKETSRTAGWWIFFWIDSILAVIIGQGPAHCVKTNAAMYGWPRRSRLETARSF